MKILASLITCCLGLTAAQAAGKSVLFVAGAKSHGPGQHEHPAGCELLAAHLNASGLGIQATVSMGWPQDAEVVANADTLVIFSDGEGRHVANGHLDALKQRHAAGKGLVVLHYALEPSDPDLCAFLLEAIGGRFEVGWSVNPVWHMKDPVFADHPLANGLQPFEMTDEFYYHIRLREDVVPVFRALPPAESLGADGPRSGNPDVRSALANGIPQTLAWGVKNPNGSRGFGFTGGHFHHHWANESFRKLVLNGIVWTAHIEVPAAGVVSTLAERPGHPTIDDAIAKGDIADVRRHLAHNPESLLKGGKPNSRPPLEQAILRNKTEIALALLTAGADPNHTNAAMRTPLHLAIDRNNPQVVAALLKAGAHPNPRDKAGWTPLHHAAAKNQLESARALLAGGADPMILSELGGTPLHEAAASGGADLIRLLLEHKVDASLKSQQGVTALDLARKYNNQAAIQVLGGE